MGRAPDYLNVTFALFAARADVWARRGNEQGAENLVRYYELMREHDLSTTHAIMNPQVDRSRPDAAGRRRRDRAAQGRRDVRGHRRARRAHARDARALRRRDLDLPGQPAAARGHAPTRSASRLPMNTPGLKVVLRDSFAKPRPGVRLPALVALRRAGRDGHLRRRRRAARPRLHGRRHGRLRRGHLAHELARADRQPGDDARVDEARARRSASRMRSPS